MKSQFVSGDYVMLIDNRTNREELAEFDSNANRPFVGVVYKVASNKVDSGYRSQLIDLVGSDVKGSWLAFRFRPATEAEVVGGRLLGQI